MWNFSKEENDIMLQLAYESIQYGGKSTDFEAYLDKSIKQTQKEMHQLKRGEKLLGRNIKLSKTPWHKEIMKKFVKI